MKSQILKEKFEKLAEKVTKEAEVINFKLKDLPDVNNYQTDIRKQLNFDKIFENLNTKINNCIYWFETDTSDNCHSLQVLLNNNREMLNLNARTVPVKNTNINTNVLYVGIRRGGQRKKDKLSNISGRIIIHLGYYDKGSTQGLQLIHWAKNVDCKINLKVVEFEDLPNDYLNTIEKIIAFKLKPMCGKH